VVRHPYRDPIEERDQSEKAGRALDAEDLAVHGVIALIGAVGVLVGVTCSHSAELVLGGLMTFFAARRLLSAVYDRWRGARASSSATAPRDRAGAWRT
jgi:hypothetical protein